MLQFLKMRTGLIGLAFLALAACSESAPATKADAADPGSAPYPNLGAFPAVPVRPAAKTREAEEKRLVEQREAAKAFDARLRAIDPILDPTARPPEPANVAGLPAPSAPAAASPTPQPAPAQPSPAFALAPVPAPAPAPALAVVQPVVPPSIATTRQAPTLQRAPTAVPAPAPIAAGTPARNSWIVGDIVFSEGSAILSAESRRTLRDAVIAAQERGGRVRITPGPGPALSPPEQALVARRAAAAGGELEALGLDRARIQVDPGALRAARVAVEF
jgi:hypothetical protein